MYYESHCFLFVKSGNLDEHPREVCGALTYQHSINKNGNTNNISVY